MEQTDRTPRWAAAIPWRWDLAAALLGAGVFLYFCSPRILSPSKIGWLLQGGDPAQHFLSWQFFRESPLVQFPLGMNPRFGSDLQSSIVFSDSLPLIALPLKYLRTVLPRVFQYHGVWILGCLMLQGVTARRLIARFVADRAQQLLGAGFFVLSPALLFRLNGHFSLLAHWILLAGISYYFADRYRRRAWLVLLCVAALVHAYLLVMAFGLWLADLAGRWRDREAGWRVVLLDLGTGTAVVVGLMFAAGYFVSGRSLASEGFGRYRLNILAPFAPEEGWSRILPSRQRIESGEYEGFNFLGLGMLALAAIALVGRRSGGGEGRPACRSVVPLLWFGGLSFAYALSTHVYLGRHELVSYDLPPLLAGVASTFRASGRMFWPVAYLIYLAVLVGSSRKLGRRVAIGVLSLLLALQAFDLGDQAAKLRHRFQNGSKWRTPLESPFWEAAAERYDAIEIVPPENDPTGFVPLSHLAALHRMSINSGYYSRFDSLKLRLAVRRQLRRLEQGRFDARVLYVFRAREGLWRRLRENREAPDFAGLVDGYAVFAPDFGPLDPSWLTSQGSSRSARRRRPVGRRKNAD